MSNNKEKATKMDVDDKKETDKKKETPPAQTSEIKQFTAADIQEEINDVVKATNPQSIYRVLRRFFTTTRRKLNKEILHQIVSRNFPASSKYGSELLGYIALLPETVTKTEDSNKMETEDSNKKEIQSLPEGSSSTTTTTTVNPPPKTEEPTPEVEIYLGLMVTIALLDNKLNKEATVASSSLIHRLQSYNRRTLNPLAARAYFYFSRSYELLNRLAEIRSALLAAHRTASLRHDEETHVTLLNLLLRNYLHYNLYDQADKLQSKTTLKEDSTSSNQLARFRYYQGRIKAIQLNYTGADSDLQEALRKAPQNSAKGFRLTVYKFASIVQLLMGDIPERSVFRQKGLKAVLAPYLRLAQAVRVGDLAGFRDVVKDCGETFRKDKTFTLIQRLRHNVIKTGLRKINLSYSCISLSDICAKLHLDNVEDAEFIVSKAIRDGVIDAAVDHDNSCIRSKENTDVYATQEPLEAFSERIKYCLKMHNDAVKAMRYAESASKIVSAEEEDREERKKQEQELADKLADTEEDDEL